MFTNLIEAIKLAFNSLPSIKQAVDGAKYIISTIETPTEKAIATIGTVITIFTIAKTLSKKHRKRY